MTTRALALAAAPILLPQGYRARRSIPRLPEAAGPRTGHAPPPEVTPSGAAPAEAPLTLLVIGESTAVGVGAATQETALAGHLARALARGARRPVAWTAVGRSGATARDVLQDLAPQVTDSSEVAVLVLGVNDTLALTSLRAWRATVARLVDALPVSRRIVLAGLPAVGRFAALPQPTRAILGRHATALDDSLAALAGDLAPRVLHVRTPVLGSGPMQALDRFHPSALGYHLWGAHLARELLARGGEASPVRAAAESRTG